MCREVIRQVMETGYALMVACAAGKWSFHYAYQQRGYEAVGGECLFVLAAYLAAYQAIRYLFDTLRGKKEHCGKKHGKAARK